MQQSHSVATDSILTPERIADLLSVMSWADIFWTDEVQSLASYPPPIGRETISNLESVFVSLRPVAGVRVELERLGSGLLLDGFGVWAARQRGVMHQLARLGAERG